MAVVDGILPVEDKQSLSQLINDLVVGATGANASAVNRFENISIHTVLKGVAVFTMLLGFVVFYLRIWDHLLNIWFMSHLLLYGIKIRKAGRQHLLHQLSIDQYTRTVIAGRSTTRVIGGNNNKGLNHSKYSDVTMSAMAFQIICVLIVQPFDEAQIKVNIKAVRHWHLGGESTGDRGIPLTKGQ